MGKIFTGNSTVDKTAFLNWRTANGADIENMMVLADGFLNSSIELTKNCLKDNKFKKADILIFPILFNANHGIELYLKSLVWTLNQLIGSSYKIEGKHNIKQILQTAQGKISKFKGENALIDFNQKTRELQDYINELYDLIETDPKKDNIDFSRYPITEKYENHFYIEELNNVEVDLENFVSTFEKIKESLEEIVSYYYYQELNQDW